MLYMVSFDDVHVAPVTSSIMMLTQIILERLIILNIDQFKCFNMRY